MTKKVGSTGRFGPRYGWGVKTTVEKIERKQKLTYVCPSCKSKSMKRISVGIWQCMKCKAKYAGGAYSPMAESIVSE